MRSIAFHNLGCKVNEYEMEVMQQIVQKHGYKIVEFTQKADIYLVNTCTVTNIADRKSRQMLHRARQLNPEAVVIAAGCYAQTGIEDLKKDLAVDIIIGNNHKTEIADIIDRYFAEHNEGKYTVMSELAGPTDYENTEDYESSDRTRVDVKIQDGCNQFCSYCAIPLARGRVRSRRPDDIIREIERLIENGHREIVLTGIHISSYGIDFDDEAWKIGDCKPSEHESAGAEEMMKDYRGRSKLIDLVELIDRSFSGDKLLRIRLGSLEPRIVTEDTVERLTAVDRVCPHFHLSLQSGCDTVLKRMNRHYSTGEYREGVDKLRAAYEKCGRRTAITTDVIVGFPGETDEEFSMTREYLEDMKLYEMHIFKYSRRKNTVADRMPGQIADSVKAARSDELLKMTARHSKAYREKVQGEIVSVLFEEERDGYITGHTEDYIKVAVRTEELKKSGIGPADVYGRLMAVKIDGFLGEDTVTGTFI